MPTPPPDLPPTVRLVEPTTAVRVSFLAAVDELVAEGRATPESMVGDWIARFGDRWHEPEGFVDFVRSLREEADPAAPRRIIRVRGPQAREYMAVEQSTYWLVEGEEYLGRVSLRHRLNEWLRELGGHVGYEVRPSRRREGHATTMMRAVLPHARALGLEEVLVTCDHDNVGSRKVIEAAGGRFEDQRGAKLRYWVPTSG